MSPRRIPAAIDGAVLIAGNADDVVAALTAAARRDGVVLVDPHAEAAQRRAIVGIAAVRTPSRSTLAGGIRTLDEHAALLEPDAARLVIAVRQKLTITPERLLGPLVNEILFQVSVATGGLEGARRLRRARARFGAALLDA
ncbi:MAG: hypothetical protein QM626_10455, partial [Microbacterium sp.]|uniref:hypothetical protein n=1 Tax=Microbacterium sp. TaxID=51671 RepID=UPI0039E3CA32